MIMNVSRISNQQVYKIPQDRRKITWAELERDVQKRAVKKDRNFKLSGSWKKFVREEGGLSIYSVDGEWLRNNLSANFGHVEHGYVFEFVPIDEIWIDTHHKKGCGCKRVRKDRKMSVAYFESTVAHEIKEIQEMKKGLSYWKAHQMALQKERELGILSDPFTEKYR